MSVAVGGDRAARTREEILRIAAELIVDSGVGVATVYAIARRAGVSNVTIYREWPNRATLLAEAFASAFPTPPARSAVAAPYGELVETIAALMTALDGDVGMRLLEIQVLLPAGEARDGFTEATLGQWHSRVGEIWRTGVEHSVFDGGIDESTAVDQILGPILLRSLMTGAPTVDTPAGLAQRIDLALNGLRP